MPKIPEKHLSKYKRFWEIFKCCIVAMLEVAMFLQRVNFHCDSYNTRAIVVFSLFEFDK